MFDDITISKFWSKVDKTPGHGPKGECWLWGGSKTRGYGRVRVNDRNRVTHQVSWEIANQRPFPEGMMGCHECDNPPCCNPAHIWPGTNSDNVKDAIAKGRYVPKPPFQPKRTHCKHGHTLDDARVAKSGKRDCRTCHKRMQVEYRAKLAAIRNLIAEPGASG